MPDVRALMFGVEPEAQPVPETDNRLLVALARTPMRLVELDDPGFLRPDWVVTKPRSTQDLTVGEISHLIVLGFVP